ncbi:conserved Plasmodium protein, unknown function [Plasmodium yoelii]|uniref:Uncharacterized protein n=3 Tax=Plasmodium yoelii TaxID=5861 RepID=A0AAE9WYI7_PLAYO|nr:conserved Plasmodium protein, unknown function [Plasmodium yoelii]WBY58832.1 hypothetical protein Py17XNL_001105797 [Plasmodium yoelii yoelii]CDU19092.1 conserved Plasmodium protein, unknown function [Plasmodium yoelii]VTZ79677.1 conserved Plasmodium protein, unknown function [Plasmodium yoelii]|eukprot:XP_726328.2 conserved Plasmodium protein, unknown function [Plasmodium yoelii]
MKGTDFDASIYPEKVDSGNINKLKDSDMNEIFSIDLKSILKNVSNENELNCAIEIINDKITTLNDFIKKITKKRYEYFYKYIDKLCNTVNVHNKNKEENATYNCETVDITKIINEYNNNYEELKGIKAHIFSLIDKQTCLIEIEKIIKLYEILDKEIKIICNEISENPHFKDLNLNNIEKKLDEMEKIKNRENKNDNFEEETVVNNNSRNVDDTNSIDFYVLVKYLKRLSDLLDFINYHNIENVLIVKLKIKKLKYYQDCIVNIFINYLSANFYKDKNCENNVKHCLYSFSYLNIGKECFKSIINNKINKHTHTYISNIKELKQNVKENFFLIIQNCKNIMDQISYINNVMKNEGYINDEVPQKREFVEYSKLLNTTPNEVDHNFSINNFLKEEKEKNVIDIIDIYSEFYLPYINLLIDNKLNEYIKKEDMLHILNLCEEFLNVIKKKNYFKIQEKDLLLILFKKEYEEITFNSINKLVNLVELLFQKTNMRSSIDHENDYNFPTIFDIKNYVDVFYTELYTHIFFPYIFRKIIVSCNNSLLLLSNNLNNLRLNLNLRIDIDTRNKHIIFDYIYKHFKYNLELFLISRQLLKYLILNLCKLKNEVTKIKMLMQKKDYNNLYTENLKNDSYTLNMSKNDEALINLSFNESHNEFFNFQDYLNNNSLCDNWLFKYHKEYITEDNTNLGSVKNKKNDQECNNMQNEYDDGLSQNKENVFDNLFKISLTSDVKYSSLNMNESYNIYGDDENYEISSFFVKIGGKKKINKYEKKNFFDLIELEKGICELNNAVNLCLHEFFEIFEKKTIWFLKNNIDQLNTDDTHFLFDQLCISFYNNIIQHIPLYECLKIINNLITRLMIYLVAISSYYLIEQMDVCIFKYYKSTQKIYNNIITSYFNFDYKLCDLFKRSIDVRNGKEPYESVPSFFVPVTFIILHEGKNIVNYLNITEDKFINLIVDHLKNPIREMGKKSMNEQSLNFMLNKFAKSLDN